jgi:hypothetical protein
MTQGRLDARCLTDRALRAPFIADSRCAASSAAVRGPSAPEGMVWIEGATFDAINGVARRATGCGYGNVTSVGSSKFVGHAKTEPASVRASQRPELVEISTTPDKST